MRQMHLSHSKDKNFLNNFFGISFCFDKIFFNICYVFFILDIKTEKIIEKCAIFDSIFDFGFGF